MEKKLRKRFASTIQDCIADEVEQRVSQEVSALIYIQQYKSYGRMILTVDCFSLTAQRRSRAESPRDPTPRNTRTRAPIRLRYSTTFSRRSWSSKSTYVVSPLRGRRNMKIDLIRLFHGATDDEEGYLHSDFGEVRTESGSPLSSREHDYYQSVKMPLLYGTRHHPSTQPRSLSHRLFDESQEHEPPPPSPIPAAGPLRPLLRPLPTPEQSPAHVVHNILPFRCASLGCATLTTAYPSAPAPTNEPIIMVYPLRNAQVGPLSPVSEVLSPLASKNLNLRFEKDREYMRSNDCVISASMTEWPKTRTIIKTPAGSARSSPLMVPPPIEPHLVYDPINRLQCS